MVEQRMMLRTEFLYLNGPTILTRNDENIDPDGIPIEFDESAF